jgi:hypothetical protein
MEKLKEEIYQKTKTRLYYSKDDRAWICSWIEGGFWHKVFCNPKNEGIENIIDRIQKSKEAKR